MKSGAVSRVPAVIAAIAVLGSTAGCERPQRAENESGAVYVAHRPPSAKDVIDAALASAAVPLSVSTTCNNAGTEPSDQTIGRYLAGFMAEMSDPRKNNWIETSVEPRRSVNGDVWICNLTLRHLDGDDRWGWGVRFEVRQSDGRVIPQSYTCTGAG
jgi:hypothetical protein